MNQFLIDTDIWIDFLNKRSHGIQLISTLQRKGKIFSSILTVTELRAGWTDERAENFLPIFYAYTSIAGISRKIAELAGRFLKEYKMKGVTLPTVDTLIGATAIIEGYQLVTRNKKDFSMPQLKFYKIEE